MEIFGIILFMNLCIFGYFTYSFMQFRKKEKYRTQELNHKVQCMLNQMQREYQSELSFIGKGILYICLTIVAIVFVNSCQVDEEVIKQCETSCSSNGNRMDSVSVFGCDCEQKQDSLTSPWVVPPPGEN